MVARGFRLLDEEDFQAASDTFDRAARLLPDAHGPRIGRLFLNANAGEYRTARRGGEALAAEGATRAELYYLLGLLSDLDGETEKARQEFERCLFLDAECLMARFRLAELHSRRDDWRAASREARNLLEQLRDLNPGALVPLSGGMSREAMETLCLGLMKSEGFGDR